MQAATAARLLNTLTTSFRRPGEALPFTHTRTLCNIRLLPDSICVSE